MYLLNKNLLSEIQAAALRGNRAIEHGFDTVFAAAANPWRHLGALGFLFFWIVVVSGVYLYAAFDTSVAGALGSIDNLSRDQRYIGGILHSLHRYAADAFVLVTLLHLLRELLLGRFTGFRSFSWLTGVPLLWFIYVAGVVGFWLKWDRMAQYAALASAEWLDALPFFATPLTRNFLSAAAVSDRLFSLFVFIHIGIPLLLLFGLWFHIRRINRADVFPPRALAAGTLATLLLLSLVAPVGSEAAADLSLVPASLPLDWFYLFPLPLMEASSAGAVWALAAAVTLALLLLPLWPQAKAVPVAVVTPSQCNGCERCFDDCPYAAIVMAPHPSGKPGQKIAEVLTDMCASCGICAGSCPSSTPFRSAAQFSSGIDMPQQPVAALRSALELYLRKHDDAIVVFGCEQGVSVDCAATPNAAGFNLLCTGMLPPSFIDYSLRSGAAGVLVTGCRDCTFRLGRRWTTERIDAAREPHLHAAAERARVRQLWADPGEEAELADTLADFRRELSALPAQPATTKRMTPKRTTHE